MLMLSLVMTVPALAGGEEADADDVVEFGGSRLVGEIKHLDRGKLYFKTDATGTIEIEWPDVTRLESNRMLRIERRDGAVIIGSLSVSDKDDTVVINSYVGSWEQQIEHIVSFDQFEEDFWDRLDIDTVVGYSFTKSNGVQQLNLAADLRYDTEDRSHQLSMSHQQSTSDNAETTLRRTVDLQTLRYTDTVYFSGWTASFERNDALGLDHRFLGAWVFGREFYPLSNQRLRLAAGLDVSEEAGREASSTTSSELVLNGSIDWYRFSSPELDLTSSVSIFPSLTEKGRVRAKADLRLRWEIYDDLFWDLTFYDDYDNQPTSGENADGSGSNDYGITTGLGWSW